MQATAKNAGHGDVVPVAVLFSGGLDSMILAAILHECLDAKCRCFDPLLKCFSISDAYIS